jgi:hypothetical protein
VKPTDPKFFALWSISDLQKECARLNQVIKEASDLAWQLEKTFDGNIIEQSGGMK